MLLNCNFVGWCNLSPAEQIALITAIFTGLAVIGTAIYVGLTYRIMDSTRESVAMLAEKEKPFLSITNISFLHDTRAHGRFIFNLWGVTIANGGITNALITNIRIKAETVDILRLRDPNGVESFSFSKNIFVAPNHECTLLCGIDQRTTGTVFNRPAELTIEVVIIIDYSGIGKDTYTYTYSGAYYNDLNKFIAAEEEYQETTQAHT